MVKYEVQLFGLVRDKNGNPKIDGDPNDLPEETKELLTDDERKKLGVK